MKGFQKMSGKMNRKVRSKAPPRLGFGGGGTDVSPYADDFGGYVLNVTINKYAYCTISSNTIGTHFKATDIQEANIYDAKYENEKCLLMRGVWEGLIGRNLIERDSLNITTYSDAPGGSGLGSSSTMVVAIIQAFVEYYNLPLGEYDVAELAWEIERKDLDLAGGKQDQFCATHGGWNFMEFYKDKTIVNPLRVKREFLNELSSSLLIYFTGKQRSSGDVIKEQIKSQKTEKSLEALHSLKHSALLMKEALLKSDCHSLGNILNQSWEEKKKTSNSISNAYVDEIFSTAISSGAFAGKLSGAGSSGFMMFLVEPEKKLAVKTALEKFGGVAEDVQFSEYGAESWVVKN